MVAKTTHLALVAPKLGALNFTGAAMPWKPPIDKILALCLLHNQSEQPLETLDYWKQNECPPEQFADWRDLKIYPIDIGDRKYHKAGVGSASEFIVKEFGLKLTDGFQSLVSMINENNKTGNLKGRKFAVAHMLREMYELEDSQELHLEIIRKTMDVLEAHARVVNGELNQPEEGLSDALPDLVEQFAGCNNAALTLGRYLRDLWLLGEEPAEIRSRIDFWLNGWGEVQARLAKGVEAFNKLSPLDWSAAGTKGIALHTDDRFLAKAAIKSGRYGIRIIVSGTGHTVISTNGFDLSKLHAALEKLEPGRWYYQAKMGALINGGPQYVGVEPTGVGSQQLIGLLKMHVQPKAKK